MLFITPQVATVPSIRYDDMEAARLAHDTPTERYQGHLADGSSVQAHSAGPLYAQHRVVIHAVEGANGRRLWVAKQGERVLCSHPRHCCCELLAHAALNGA
jgi:hypothetical protein